VRNSTCLTNPSLLCIAQCIELSGHLFFSLESEIVIIKSPFREFLSLSTYDAFVTGKRILETKTYKRPSPNS
ncbi:hypothetical protein EWB00_009790, partial [Schistosoma japonicum]